VDHGETGLLVPPDDQEAMAGALVRMVNGPDSRRQMGETAYERSRERYSWPALAEKVARVYDQVAGPADAAPTLP
jgi:glycosyltransferase involved in cell wall biosynthesis